MPLNPRKDTKGKDFFAKEDTEKRGKIKFISHGHSRTHTDKTKKKKQKVRSVRLGTGFPKTATSTSMCASLRPSMAYEIFGKPVPNPTDRTFCWSLVSIAFSFSFLSVWVRECPWLINFIFPCFSVSSVAKKSLPLVSFRGFSGKKNHRRRMSCTRASIPNARSCL